MKVAQVEMVVKCDCGEHVWIEAGVLEDDTTVELVEFMCGGCLTFGIVTLNVQVLPDEMR